jgi:hypothetical protein
LENSGVGDLPPTNTGKDTREHCRRLEPPLPKRCWPNQWLLVIKQWPLVIKQACANCPCSPVPRKTDDPHYADRRNFYKVEKWSKDRQWIEENVVRLARTASMQKRQAHADKADDQNSDSAEPSPPNIVMSALLLEPLSFNLITRPTKRCLRIA